MSWLRNIVDGLGTGQPACLVTVACTKGSVPREAGTSMVVLIDGIGGSIGGGRLEHRAIQQARAQLTAAGLPGPFLEEVVLGPQCGQCCGGKVWLAFEWFEPSDLDHLRSLANAPAIASKLNGPKRPLEAVDDANAQCRVQESAGEITLIRSAGKPVAPLYLFGAGHVGRAVVQALGRLPFHVRWVDSRPEMFAPPIPDNVVPRPALDPLTEVGRAPSQTYYLVMTHEHDLDERLCEQILLRRDFVYLGLIGSETKARRFQMRLANRDVPGLERLTCPIGLPGIRGKDPAIIAASVAADLLQRLEHPQNDWSKNLGNATC